MAGVLTFFDARYSENAADAVALLKEGNPFIKWDFNSVYSRLEDPGFCKNDPMTPTAYLELPHFMPRYSSSKV